MLSPLEAGRMKLILARTELYNLKNKQMTTCGDNTLIYSLHLQIIEKISVICTIKTLDSKQN